MDIITYKEIEIGGVPIDKLLHLNIKHTINDHGYCHIEGEATCENAKEFMDRVDESFGVQITTTAEGQPKKLFYGAIQMAREEMRGDEYSILVVDCVTTSGMLDIQKNNRSFQQKSKKYEDIINTVLDGRGTVEVKATDKAIDNLIMQCEETDWEFAMRMASHLESPVCANIVAEKPQLYIGVPPSSKTVKPDTVVYENGKVILGGGTSEHVITGDEYVYLGDTVNYEGYSGRVISVNASMIGSKLITTFGFATPGENDAFVCKKVLNQNAVGRLLQGTVKKVEKDKVQVFLHTIDKEYDGSGDFWFPYATPYSSKDNSGWYCMPEVDDEIRVLFPSGEEGEAFVGSSLMTTVCEDVEDKMWRGMEGKEIRMCKDGLIIMGKEESSFIWLAEDGIQIVSDKAINIMSEADINLTAEKAIHIASEKEIELGSGDSTVKIEKSKITITSKKINMA